MHSNFYRALIALSGFSFGCSGTESLVATHGSSAGNTASGGLTNPSALGGKPTTGGTGSEATQPIGGTAPTSTDSGGTSSLGNTSWGGSGYGGRTSDGSSSKAAGGAAPAGGRSQTGGATGGRSSKQGTTTAATTTVAGGSLATGGGTQSFGGSATGGVRASGGSSISGGGTDASACDAGATATAWATNCPTAAPVSCKDGPWTAGGPDPDHSSFKLCSESTHFAVYSDEACTATAQTAVTHLETVWNLYFGSPMYMREPLCDSTTKYKASVHVHSDWGLTGGSWAANRMGMWIGTGGLTDHWGLAHEFMHGVQSVQGGMSCNQSNTCGWIYESHANWAAQQQTEYHTTNVHCSEMLANAPHLYLGSTRDRYCNWQFMEYLKDRFCFSAVNDIWTGTRAADPFTAIMNSRQWSIGQLNDFFGEWAMHNVTWDYQDPTPQSTAGGNQGALFRKNYGLVTDTSKPERRLRLVKLEPLELTERRFVVPKLHAPQRWGYNTVQLFPDSGTSSVSVSFRGVIQSGADTDFRWGLVATDAGLTKPRYSKLQSGTDGSLTFCVSAGESLFLVITATPSAYKQIIWDQAYPTIHRYPYMIQLGGAWPDGYQGGNAATCPSGTTRVSNGGGCGPSTLPATVYVGPYAQVLGGTVSGTARIDDHAVVLGGTVSGGTVAGLSIVKSGMTISGGTEAVAWPYAPGYFETPQSLSGAAQLLGDIEYRDANLSKTSGSYCGFVDSSTNSNCTGADVTLAPPYAWRP